MPDPAKPTPRQRAHRFYMMEAMRRLEWDLHNAIDSSGRIPETWHEIAAAPPHPKRERVTLRLNPEVVKFFRSMGSDYGPRINAMLESFMDASGNKEKLRDAFTKAVPMGRMGRPDDLPGAILFFASDDAGFVTGQVISVNGGLY